MLERILKFINEEKAQRSFALTNGVNSIKDYTAYRQVVAEFKTLELVEEFVRKTYVEDEA